MIHSTATLILPYIEQTTVYDMFDHKTDPIAAYAATPSGDAFKTSTGCLLHRNSKGRNYDDPAHPSGQVAAKTKIDTFICPSIPISNLERDPVHGYGGIDYMVLALSDIDARPGSSTYGMRTTPIRFTRMDEPGCRSDARLRRRRLQSSHRRKLAIRFLDRRRRAGASRCERFTERTPRVSLLCRVPRIPSICRAAETGDACLRGPMRTQSVTAIPDPAMRSVPVQR